MRKLIIILFFNPEVRRRIKSLEDRKMNLMLSIRSSMPHKEKANILTESKEIDSTIEIFKKMLC